MAQNSVLVVDDDEAVLMVTTEMLKHLDCDVAGAGSGREALALLDEREYDVVLLDVAMPIMSGADVYAAIQANRPDQRVVFMTGYSEEDMAELLDDRTGVLLKPFGLQVLQDTLDGLLNR